MTDGYDQALANAGLALLNADPLIPALKVYDGVVPNGVTPPYVLVYTRVARPRDHPAVPLTGVSSGFVVRLICHCVGGDAIAARAVAQRARTQLLDVRPVVAGLQCNPFRQIDAIDPTRDETLGTPVMDAVEVYEALACL
jgi:hypothetical protein